MIIEDESIIAKDIECILKNYSYDIAGPYSRAEEAIAAMEINKPDLILMDIVLKGDIDGIEAAKIIKEKYSIPIIYLTAYADDITINRIKSTEPYGYFLKPFEEKELYTWIETSLHKFKKEEELKEKVKWLESVLKVIDKAAIAVNQDGFIKFVNNKAESITGYKEEEITDKPFDDIIIINSENNNTAYNIWENLKELKQPVFDINHSSIKRKNNEKVDITYSLFPVLNDNKINGYLFTLQEKKTSNGNFDAVIKDLTDKLNISKNELKQFAYVASHDLQEPLRMIASYVQLLQRRYQGKIDSGADEYISFAVEGVNRMKTLLNDLLTYSRLNTIPAVFTLTDCNVIIQQSINVIKNEFPGKKFEVNFDNTLPLINADSGQMRQMFHHFLSNAVKFNDKEVAVITISSICRDKDYEFKIKDNGIGMDSEYYSRIFEVFQRLHNYNEYPGTGIGLAICKKIVENHHGMIKVESIPLVGSTFHITISSNEIQ